MSHFFVFASPVPTGAWFNLPQVAASVLRHADTVSHDPSTMDSASRVLCFVRLLCKEQFQLSGRLWYVSQRVVKERDKGVARLPSVCENNTVNKLRIVLSLSLT